MSNLQAYVTSPSKKHKRSFSSPIPSTIKNSAYETNKSLNFYSNLLLIQYAALKLNNVQFMNYRSKDFFERPIIHEMFTIKIPQFLFKNNNFFIY